jgi:hypothetical protein
LGVFLFGIFVETKDYICSMYNVDDVYKLLKYRFTKSGFNGTISPNDFNVIFPRAENRYFALKYRNYLQDQRNQDALLPFKSNPVPITIDNTGKYTKPLTMLHIDSITYGTNISTKVEVINVTDDRLGNYLNSTYDAPSLEFPIYVEYALYLQFFPITLASANTVSLDDFTPTKWAYTLVSGRPVYDFVNSVQPRWYNDSIDAIIYMAGEDIGLNMRDQMEIQVNDAKAKESA